MCLSKILSRILRRRKLLSFSSRGEGVLLIKACTFSKLTRQGMHKGHPEESLGMQRMIESVCASDGEMSISRSARSIDLREVEEDRFLGR